MQKCSLYDFEKIDESCESENVFDIVVQVVERHLATTGSGSLKDSNENTQTA